jgi:indolepyruvate ferredoxin oxidoreductase alpha subunit
MMTHPLLTDTSDRKMLLLGNEAIARGALEAGVAFASSYPGTPSSEIALQFFHIAREQSDLYFEYSANEKVALEVAAGAAMCGLRAIVSMKHVGLNVASDALLTLAYTGITGALVVAVSDDPFMYSSQNEQDSRYYAKLSSLPMLEPSSVQEAKDMTRYAFDLSTMLKLPIILRTTTRVNHASGVVALGHLRRRMSAGSFHKDPFSYVCIPSVSRNLHPKLLKKAAEAASISDESHWNFIKGRGSFGVVCNGASYGYVVDAITESGYADRFRILRLGFSHPIPEKRILDFLYGCERALVVEEGEPYLEESVRVVAHKNGLTVPVFGKGEGFFSRLYEFDPGLVKNVLAKVFDTPFPVASPIDTSDFPATPPRPPNLCAGCPHRAAYLAVREVLGDSAIYPTDIGCYTLGLHAPLNMGDFLIAMGAGLGSAGGFARATGKKVVAFIGDSTFFHSGLSPLASAVYNRHNFLLVILDNGTTGMTGHQPHPGVDVSHLGLDKIHIDIESVVRGLGVQSVATVNPLHFSKAVEAVKRTSAGSGVSVLIMKAPCPLYEKTLPGYKSRRPYEVRPERCKNHRVCVDRSGCPAFHIEENRVEIDSHRCTGCALCAQLCPEKAIRPVAREDNKG